MGLARRTVATLRWETIIIAVEGKLKIAYTALKRLSTLRVTVSDDVLDELSLMWTLQSTPSRLSIYAESLRMVSAEWHQSKILPSTSAIQ